MQQQPTSTHRFKQTPTTVQSTQSDVESEDTNGDTIIDESETRSTASTAASTHAHPVDNTSRFQDLERMSKAAQKRSDLEGKASAAQLSGLQTQFSDLDCKISALQTTQQKLATDLSAFQDNNSNQFNDLRANMISSM